MHDPNEILSRFRAVVRKRILDGKDPKIAAVRQDFFTALEKTHHPTEIAKREYFGVKLCLFAKLNSYFWIP